MTIRLVCKQLLSKQMGRAVIAWMSVVSMMAADVQGLVQSNAIPLPGASVTAVQGDQKVTTTSDEQGRFTLKDLADGAWTITVEMLGFGKTDRTFTSPSTDQFTVDMKLLSKEALEASLNQAPAAQRPATKGGPGAGFAGRAGRGPGAQAANGTPNGPAPAGAGAPPQGPGRGGQNQAKGNGRGGPAQPGPARDAFQQVDVTQLADESVILQEGNINTQDLAALNQSAANSLTVQGSLSSGLGIPAQGDFGPPGGFGPGGFGGPGGPGGFGALNALNDNGGAPGQQGPNNNGGGGGRGGPGPGGPGGGPGGRGPGGGGPGGRGQGNFNGGGRGKGKGGPPNQFAFGNRRPNQRSLYNGNVSFQLSNSALDARTYSVTGADLAKPAYANGRVGITFGGPLQIPKLLSADKRINFTFDYQITRNRTGQLSQAVNMPTALERTGDFSQTLIQGKPVTVYDPTTGLPYAGNKIPTSLLNPASQTLLNYFPLPNLPYAARNYQTSWNGLNNSQNLNIRFNNVPLTTKDRLNFGTTIQSGNSVSPNLFQFIDTGTTRNSNSNIAWSRRITPKLTNNVQLQYSQTRQLATPFFSEKSNVANTLGIQGTSQNPVNWGPPNLNFTNYGGLSDGNYSSNRNQTINLSDTLSWSHGKHNLQMGVEFRRALQNQYADSNGRGTYSFTGQATSSVLNGAAVPGTGYDLADFLLGRPASATIRYGNPDKYFRGNNYALYFNDDFRMSNKISWTLGARWDYSSPISELYNRLSNIDIGNSYTTIAAVQPGQVTPFSGTLPNTLVHPDRNNISPRLGLAYKPSSKRSTVLRLGYGVYYNSSIYQSIASNLAQQPPFAQTLSVSNSLANPLNLQTGFLSASSRTINNTYAIDPNYKTGYAQTWSFTLQNNLPFGMFFTAGYQGTKGTRLDQRFIPNSVAPGAPTSPYPNFFTYETSGGNSIYHAAQFQLNRRFSRGLQANLSYQFSKSIDNAGTGQQGPIAQNWLNLSAERALSTFNVPHNLQLQFQYSSGNGRGGGALVSGWKGALSKDWTVTGNLQLRSGTPLTATVGGASSQIVGSAVGGTVRAMATGQSISAPGMNFNTAAFALPATGQWGNAGRDTIPGPTLFQLNGQVGRIFRLGERRTADLNLQAQNILNRVTVTGWGTTVGSNNFGLVSSASQMRRVTLNLRFRF